MQLWSAWKNNATSRKPIGPDMIFAGLYIFVIMLLIAIIHVYWAFGGRWPGTNEKDLVEKVVGRGESFPSVPITCFVSLVFVAMAVVPLVKAGLLDTAIPAHLVDKTTLFFAVIFFLRGMGGYLRIFEKTSADIFVYYNRRIYNPLCVSLGVAELILILN
jgi:hypothetical protein